MPPSGMQHPRIAPQLIAIHDTTMMSDTKQVPCPDHMRITGGRNPTHRTIVSHEQRVQPATLDDCQSLRLPNVHTRRLTRDAKHVPIPLNRQVLPLALGNQWLTKNAARQPQILMARLA